MSDMTKAHDLQLRNARARIAVLEQSNSDLTALIITMIVGSDTDRVLVPEADIKNHRNHSLNVSSQLAAPPKECETDAEPQPVRVVVLEVVRPEARPRVLRAGVCTCWNPVGGRRG